MLTEALLGKLHTTVDPFVPGRTLRRQEVTTGPLAGLTFAVKDLIDMAGVPTGAGTPDYAKTHPMPEVDAPVVQSLLAGGATCLGKVITDELAFDIIGRNYHDGAPLNAAAPRRVCGGSSSGSASAVALGKVDFALGTDTTGSVRVPASFCGLYGMRPTHGRVSSQGVVALAPSMDTVGWLARSPRVMRKVGETLFGVTPDATSRPFKRLLIAEDAFDFADPKIEKRTAKVARAD